MEAAQRELAAQQGRKDHEDALRASEEAKEAAKRARRAAKQAEKEEFEQKVQQRRKAAQSKGPPGAQKLAQPPTPAPIVEQTV